MKERGAVRFRFRFFRVFSSLVDSPPKNKNLKTTLTSPSARTSLLPRHGLSPCTSTDLRNISCKLSKVVSAPPETTAGHESGSLGFAEAASTLDHVAEAEGAASVAGRGGSVLLLFF